VCDSFQTWEGLDDKDLPARVVLVPKDSRGPRLISCEPVDNQWIQQGLHRAIVRHVEHSPLTRYNVHFTDQGPNQRGALLGSTYGKYATLDLNEASDRVHLELVRLLFPEHIVKCFECCRSLSTVLPNGQEIRLQKFAPMGSALCFPVLALTIWAILTAGAHDTDTRESILVYGDDVIVPTAHAANAIEQLESFGLKINRDKSCTSGFFRESCGVEAFLGKDITPVRLRTVWSSTPSPSVYTSWIAYANSFYDKRYYVTYDYIVSLLSPIYGEIPDDSMRVSCPSLRETPDSLRPRRSRIHQGLQKRQWRVWDVKAVTVQRSYPGWSKLLRYFTEAARTSQDVDTHHTGGDVSAPFSASRYTKRDTSMLVKRWR